MYITSSIMCVVLIVNWGGFGLGSETIRGRLQTIVQHSSYRSSPGSMMLFQSTYSICMRAGVVIIHHSLLAYAIAVNRRCSDFKSAVLEHASI